MGILESFFGAKAGAESISDTSNTQGTQQTQNANSSTEGDNSDTTKLEGMDKFTELITFKPDPKNAPKEFDPSELISADPEKLREQISQMNFVQGSISKEQAEAIAGGGEGAINAMAHALNTVAQRAFLQATLASKEISSETLKQSLAHLDDRIKSTLQSDKINSALTSANPALAHPAAQPMIAALIPQIRAKYPSASPEEIKDKATEYFLEFANSINPHKKEEPPKVPGQVSNWLEWAKE